MKTPTVLIAAVLCACYCTGQSNVVYYGTHSNAISLAFADTNLSTSAQEAIAADLRICLSEWGKATQFRLGADDPAFVAHLYNPKLTPHYPETLDFPDDVVSSGAAGLALHIPKKLSDAYTNAFAFAAANSNTVAAAYEFVTFISSSNFVSLSSNALPNYILFKNKYSETITESNEIVRLASQIIPGLCYQTFYTPSVLGFYYSPEGPSASNLWLNIPSSTHPATNTTEWAGYPVLWHNGKWVFCSWNEWVP
ncbi:MAG TPA: hypothetical protein PLG04_08285 [Anaerolineaceae bacterium]|nr:hypothetical protein [Anaerolineaceae bacterium]